MSGSQKAGDDPHAHRVLKKVVPRILLDFRNTLNSLSIYIYTKAGRGMKELAGQGRACWGCVPMVQGTKTLKVVQLNSWISAPH